MTIQECYQCIGGNYAEMLGRVQTEALVRRFALKFPNDGSFRELSAFLESGNVEEAFRAAHTLKGVCANLSFTKLFSSASEITEYLRAGQLEQARTYYPTVSADYEMTIAALKVLGESQS